MPILQNALAAINAWWPWREDRAIAAGTAAASRDAALVRSRAPLVFAATVLVLAGGVGAGMLWLAEEARVADRRHAAAVTAAAQASRIREQVERSISATYSLAALVRQGNGSVANFEQIAAEMLPLFPGVSALQLAPNGVIRRIVPLTGHEKALGHDLFADGARNKEAALALQTRRLTLAGPFTLLQSGEAVVGRLPVFLDNPSGGSDSFWGFTTVVVSVDNLVAASAIADLSRAGYLYELSRINPDTGARQVFSGSGVSPLRDPLVVDIAVPNGRWTLSVEPRLGWWWAKTPAVDLILGLLAALGAALAAYQAARVPAQLGQLVLRRTREIEAARVRLAESEARFRDLAEATSDWIWEVDAEGVYTYASPKVRELLGYEPSEVIGRTPFDLMPPQEAARVGHLFREIVAARRSFALLENVNLHKHGQTVVLETSGIPLLDADGRLRGYRGIDRDITARRQAEQGMRKLSLAIEQSVNGIVIADAQGLVEFANPKICEILGRSAAQVLGSRLDSLDIGLHEPEAYARMMRALAAGEPWFGEFQRQGADGTTIWGLQTISGIRGGDGGITQFVAVVEDISGRKQLESALEQFAYYDRLTGLPNRALLLDRIGQAAAVALREDRPIALLTLDIDRLKNVNDSLGHDAGDELLKAVAQRLRGAIREEDSVARLEGDEFAALIIGPEGAEDAARVAEKLCEVLRAPFRVRGQELRVTASIGVSMLPADAGDVATLERNADTALHRAKKTGDCFRFFKPKMNEAVSRLLVLENKLRVALAQSQFLLHYQPQLDLKTGRIGAVEALIRWRDPESGQVMPERFIPLAEEIGLIVPISEWVLHEACRQAVAWRDAGSPCRIAVNLSALHFRDGLIIASLRNALEATGASADLLELEITEGVVMRRGGEEVEVLRKLAAAGFRIVLDDFGCGYSSLAYLKHMPVHVLKIDGSFVQDLAAGADERAIVSTIVNLGHALRMSVLAEGVETRQQLALLKAMGCHAIQGYLYSAPLPAAELSRALRDGSLPVLT